MDTLDRLGYNLWTLLDPILGKINELCLGSCACKFNYIIFQFGRKQNHKH